MAKVARAEEMAKVAWEEEALLRHWHAHLAAYPASMRTAPLSARHTRASSPPPRGSNRSAGIGAAQRPLTARSSSSGMQKAPRRRPVSARAQAWPAEPQSTREPLSARGVAAGHAAWLRGFHQQLSTSYAPSA